MNWRGGGKMLRRVALHGICALVICAAMAGCRYKTRQTYVPPPPVQRAPQRNVPPQNGEKPSPSKPLPQATAPTASVPEAASEEDRLFVRTHTPVHTEEGYATWYTAAKGRHTANGELFDENSYTAAHRTLPMGSLILVTNLKTGQAAILRINDRGPFVAGRILDLTKMAARATGVYREGLSHVRVDVYRMPKPALTGGKWCVQIGAFKSEKEADKLKAWLQKKYPDAKVIDFPGEASYWVRIRPMDGNREEAEKIADRIKPAEGEVYLTRMD